MSTKNTVKFIGGLLLGVHLYKDGLDIEDTTHIDFFIFRHRIQIA